MTFGYVRISIIPNDDELPGVSHRPAPSRVFRVGLSRGQISGLDEDLILNFVSDGLRRAYGPSCTPLPVRLQEAP